LVLTGVSSSFFLFSLSLIESFLSAELFALDTIASGFISVNVGGLPGLFLLIAVVQDFHLATCCNLSRDGKRRSSTSCSQTRLPWSWSLKNRCGVSGKSSFAMASAYTYGRPLDSRNAVSSSSFGKYGNSLTFPSSPMIFVRFRLHAAAQTFHR
uniref:Secreted protein n=1 Tax=Haemonchus placei TaxID=6290 RepID=A0A0N4X748_HAEPC